MGLPQIALAAIAGGGAVEESEIEPDQVTKGLALKVGDDAESDPVHQHRLAEIGQPAGDHDSHHRERHNHEHGPVVGDEDFAHHRFHEPSQRGLGDGGERHAQSRKPESGPVGLEIGAHDPPGQRRRAQRRRALGGGLFGCGRSGRL